MMKLFNTFILVSFFFFGCITLSSASATKRGLAWQSGNPIADASLFTSSKVTWYYNWSPNKQSGMPSHLEFVPMLWNAAGGSSFVATAEAAGAKNVLGFNEPDNSGQANMLPSVAATAWKSFIQPLASKGINLGAPAVTNGASGLPWLKEFIGNCTGCTINFIPIHWYADIPATNTYLQTYVAEFYTTFNKPIWITEFANTDSSISLDTSFLQNSLTWLDAQSYVVRYAYFGPFRGTSWDDMISNSGTLNTLGTAFNT